MPDIISIDKVKELLEGGVNQAQELLKDTSKVDDLLQQLEGKFAEIPNVGSTLADVPLMISMVKSYVTKEYTVVSPKVVALLVSSFLYLLKGKDLIPDKTPIIGHLDDIALLTAALKLSGPELQAYKEWRDDPLRGMAPVEEAE